MRVLVAVLALLFVVNAEVRLHQAIQDADRVDGEYIVVFHKAVGQESVESHMEYLAKEEISAQTFHIGLFRGYSAKLTPMQLAYHLLQDDVINYIEENQVVSLGQCQSQITDDWNLLRISERLLDLGSADTYRFPNSAGNDVTSYVIDTGVLLTHNDFSTGRATWGFNSVDSNNQDCNGHGTHVASTIAGNLYGLSKRTFVVAVKVLNCAGSGTFAGVIAGIDWVANNHRKPATANMSLGGGYSQAVNDATNACVQEGVVMAVAAGNSNADACNFSPASSEDAIGVGATTIEGTGDGEIQEDIRSTFSNYGPCTHIYAPGTLVRGAWIGAPLNSATRTISGTSMASPHVCGVASLLLGANPNLTPAQVLAEIIALSTKDIIDFRCVNAVCNQSPNRMLYHACNQF
jgi:subtilisin family serine protease